ncbi:hypothetical protein EVAR_27383_1 [Eumeta japonica]|uniref:Uncharacterized protein n=1 Tax=Eumeta variegata TaxID=151549 RepID=A0A4C1X2H1_EUMVA|nr:hypothetical protein EVAR_27383_1 [Eumeta japonica]
MSIDVFNGFTGPLHSKYTNYITYTYIYAAAGYRTIGVAGCCGGGGGGRALLAVLGHRFLLGPLTAALVLPAFSIFDAETALLKGAWVSACGGSCGWGVALARGRGLAVEALATRGAALTAAFNAVFAPLYLFIAVRKTFQSLVMSQTCINFAWAYDLTIILEEVLAPWRNASCVISNDTYFLIEEKERERMKTLVGDRKRKNKDTR